MLTIDSNLKIKELDKLCNVLIKSDIINFNLKKVGGGFPKDLPTKIINKLNYKGTVLIINDLSLEMTDKLLGAGYKLEDITLAFGKWNNNGTVSDDKIMYNIMTDFIKHNIKEKLTVIFLGDIFMGIKHWDCIIANPPYGAIGANITNYIRQNIDYDLYVNLLPANDYKRNKTKDLFNYQSEMIPINDGFEDAAVTTHLALIHKDKVNNMTLDEFTISQCIDPQLTKYFKNQIKRKLVLAYKDPSGKKPNTWYIDKTLLVGWRGVANKHFPYDKNVETYRWNKLENIDKDTFINDKNRTRAKLTNSYELCYFAYTFNTPEEKKNIAEFIYSNQGFKFMSKVFTAENSDGNKEIFVDFALPKVDWTRPWTVETILTEFGYTSDEIKEVMDDLDNYKYLED